MTAKTDISKCLSLLFGKLKLCISLSFIVLCLLQPTANYDLAIIEDYLAGNAKIKLSIKKQNGVVVIFGEPWQLLLTGSAVPRISRIFQTMANSAGKDCQSAYFGSCVDLSTIVVCSDEFLKPLSHCTATVLRQLATDIASCSQSSLETVASDS